MFAGANHSRLTSVVYPDGFTASYQYASGLDSNISRLTRLVNGSATLEEYTYLGLGSVARRSHPEPGAYLTYSADDRSRNATSSTVTSAARSARQIESKSATFHLFDVP